MIMSIRKKLNRLKPHITGNKEKSLLREESVKPSCEVPFAEVWQKHDVKPYYFEQDYCLVREVSYPLDWKHGKYSFSEFHKAVSAWNESEYRHPLSASGHEAEELFFFDTETTGLGGGVGNTIFLLGQASVTEKSVIIKQHILPRPGSEVPLYHSFLTNIDYSKMVTYNGKAFDWPAVKTRHTLIREHVPKLPPFGHFDLYHAARRLWKHRLERLKLSVVEKEILEFERKNDIPGYLAPMIYFDYLERQDPEGMLKILQHNEYDLLSLITLYTHLTYQLLRLDEEQTKQESFEVGRWYTYLGETHAAESVFKELADSSDSEAVKARHALAFQAKKRKNWAEATALWKRVAAESEGKIKYEACIELAKIYEHRYMQYDSALDYTKMADSIEIANTASMKKEVEKRISRLEQKIAKKNV